MIQLFRWTSSSKRDDEQKYLDLFKQIKIGQGFYFSYTYDLTHTLQHNILKKVRNHSKTKEENEEEEQSDSEEELDSMSNYRASTVADNKINNSDLR